MTTISGRRVSAGLCATLLSIALLGCGGATATIAPETPSPSPSVAATPAPSATPVASPTSGASLATTGRIAFPDKGFAITLPEGWKRIDLAAGDLEALIAAAGASNASLAEAYSGQIKAMLAAGLVLFALGPDPMAGTNLNILAVPNFGVSLDLLEQASVAQLKAVAQGNIDSKRVALPAGEALHMRYEVAAQGVPTAPTVDQYIVIAGNSQLIISVTNSASGEAEAIANSLELLP
jgi:hypothetical protein